jgi:hypothetical protein
VGLDRARAGVVGWWLTAVYLGAFVAMMFIPADLTYVIGSAFAALYLPLGVAGVRVLQRGRAAAAAAWRPWHPEFANTAK